jgi:hypothetical protein
MHCSCKQSLSAAVTHRLPVGWPDGSAGCCGWDRPITDCSLVSVCRYQAAGCTALDGGTSSRDRAGGPRQGGIQRWRHAGPGPLDRRPKALLPGAHHHLQGGFVCRGRRPYPGLHPSNVGCRGVDPDAAHGSANISGDSERAGGKSAPLFHQVGLGTDLRRCCPQTSWSRPSPRFMTSLAARSSPRSSATTLPT